MKKNTLLILYVVSALSIGVAAAILLGPYALPKPPANLSSNNFQNKSSNNSASANVVNLQYAVNIAYKQGMGDYLVNSSGIALYVYAYDVQNSSKSTCYDQCSILWRPFYTQNLTVEPAINILGPAINISMFGAINRTGGTKQLTYNGYPLYYYKYDNGTGNINGQSNGSTGYLISPLGTVIYNSS